ncbi:MAG: hypothetical protein AAGG57_17010 [Pseudomonadota bacterium]
MLNAIGAGTATYTPPQFQSRVLNSTDAKLVWLLSWSGDANHVIAAKLGTMPGRVADILSENTHIGSRELASKMPPARGKFYD